MDKKCIMSTDPKGFTLIELMVVIGIIGMLVAVGIPNFLASRQRTSDAKKKAELNMLKSALRLYNNDYGHYPIGTSGMGMAGCGTGGTADCAITCTPAFASGASCDTVYMQNLPNGMFSSILYYQSPIPSANPDDFCLRAVLDNKSDPAIAASQKRCATACGSNCSGSGRFCVCAD